MLCRIGVVTGRRVDDVEGETEGLVEHLRYDAAEERTGQLEAGISIDFDEPGIEISVNHEVQSEYLEVVLISLRGKLDE